jgi:coproporphyrinogen III oxidase-like Fe-S oxidoreductase
MEAGVNGVTPVRLQPESYRELLQAERALHDYLPEFDKAEECGIECQYLREAAKEMLERIAKFKQHYKPAV